MMFKALPLVCMVMTISAGSLYAGEESTTRRMVAVNENWKFYPGGIEAEGVNFDDSSWESITIPHTWNNFDGQDGGDDYRTGISWYRKNLGIPSEAGFRRIYLQFDGVNLISGVYLNGVFLGEHKGGYARFRFDVTDVLSTTSDNILAVKVTNYNRGGISLYSDSGGFYIFWRDLQGRFPFDYRTTAFRNHGLCFIRYLYHTTFGHR